jgi:hypothetical protein
MIIRNFTGGALLSALMAEIITEARTESEIFTFQATTVRGQ